MKSTTSLLLLMSLTIWVRAQITITSETFPMPGDTLRTAIDNTDVPPEVQFLLPGGNQTWDFSFLSKDVLRTTVYRPASEGAAFASFADAEMMSVDPSGRENYYDVSTTGYGLVGQNGMGFLDIPLPLEMRPRYNPVLTERASPLNFFDIRVHSSGILYGFDAQDLPAEILNLLPVMPDSLRFRVSITHLDAADAYGTAIIPGGVYEVLRKERTTYIEKRIDGKIAPLGWLDVTDIAIQYLGLHLGVDTLNYYFYFAEAEKEPIVVVGYNPVAPFNYERVAIVEFKDVDTTSAIGDLTGIQPELILSPSPASDEVHYEFRNSSPGAYTMQVFDLSGNLVITEQLTSQTGTIRLDMLSSGAYAYQVLNENGQLIAGGKLVKGGR